MWEFLNFNKQGKKTSVYYDQAVECNTCIIADNVRPLADEIAALATTVDKRANQENVIIRGAQ